MPLDLSRIRAICFDVDGTLSDTDNQWVAAFEHRLRGARRFFPSGNMQPLARWMIMTAESPANLVYQLLDWADLDDEMGRFYSYLSQRWAGRKPKTFWLVPGVREMLCRMHGRFPMSVVSARDSAGTAAFLNQFDLTGFFHSVATALTCRYTKPFPDPILWAAGQMGVPPEACLMVGDTTVDIRAGRAAGAQTVGVLCGFGQEDELRRAGADLILPDTAALAEILLPSAK